MKSIRNIAFSALLTFGAFGAITYTSCNKDECKDVVCQNGGTCNEGNCECSSGYEGTNCETKSVTKFIGTWAVSENCDGSNNTYQVTITADPSDVTRVIVSNLGDYGCSVGGTITWNGSVNASTITIKDNKCSYQMDATGTFNNGQINFDYSVSYELLGATVTDNCTATLAK